MSKIPSRPFAATIMGLVFVASYVAAAVTLSDVLPNHWAVQAIYFLVAGVAWVFPIRWLMFWSVGKR